jgi:hypothetical protein
MQAQVGIGTSSPTTGTKFEIVGSGNTSATSPLRVLNSSSATPSLLVRDDGQVGIGTSSPTSGLEVVTNGSALNAFRVSTNQAYNSSPDAGIAFRFKYNTAGEYTSGAVISALKENNTDGDQSGSLRFWTTNSAGTTAERMRISSSGNVGIGTASPDDRLVVASSNTGGTVLGITNTSTGGAYWRLYSTGSGNGEGAGHLLFHNGSVRMMINSSGNVGIGTTSPADPLHVSGNVRATSYNSSSDARLKNILQNWASNDHIDFVQFRWKNGIDNREHYGYLAQDVQKVLPDAVFADSDGIMAVNYDEVHSFKIANLEQLNKEQQQQITDLKQTVEELKKMIKRKRTRH